MRTLVPLSNLFLSTKLATMKQYATENSYHQGFATEAVPSSVGRENEDVIFDKNFT
jgi:hypothetical protein